ncbi:unnamed protein product, partial [Dovyalis caffra]
MGDDQDQRRAIDCVKGYIMGNITGSNVFAKHNRHLLRYFDSEEVEKASGRQV